jgi:hypothetical protein
MGGIHALDQSHLLFYVHPLHDHSCDQTPSIKHELHEFFTNYANAETKKLRRVLGDRNASRIARIIEIW